MVLRADGCAVTSPNPRGDIRTWTLLVLALLPTWAVLTGAAFLWSERGREIVDFESALVPVEATHELFVITSPLLRAESSLQLAAAPDSSAAVVARAEQDLASALASLEDAESTLVPLIGRLDPQREAMIDGEILSLLGGSLSLGIAKLEQQVVGEPVDEQLTLLVTLARQSAAGLVLPFVNSADPNAGYLYDALGATIEYHDRFDRDRTLIIDAFASNEPLTQDLISSDIRTNSWKDLTDSRVFVPVNAHVDWFGTSASPDAPLLLDTNDPLQAILAGLDGAADQPRREQAFLSLQELDEILEADIDLAYTELSRETDEHLTSLHKERTLTGLTSLLMAALGMALAGLTISEVRRRRRVESAHSEAVQQLSEKAERDPTTGTWNRRRLESSMKQRIAVAPAANEIVVLAYLDLDHFKAINDVWGHGTGDEVLRTVTSRLDAFAYRGVPL